jgi:phage terminase large subunit-like protein
MASVSDYDNKLALKAALEEKIRREAEGGHLRKFFPLEGPFKYSNYPKHMKFFGLGSEHRERLLMAANRVGKSVAGGFELACHLTGQYPVWWDEVGGRRFNHPVDAWAAGDTGQTTRDIIQDILLGYPSGSLGTGLISGDLIINPRKRPGIPDAFDTVKIKHSSGGESILGFKSYDQGRRSFQGTGKHVIWLDEECPADVYNECLMRTMTTGGMQYVTFTPLTGMTQFIQDFLKGAYRAAMDDGMVI